MTSRSLLKQALLASRDVIISSQICVSKLQGFFTLGERMLAAHISMMNINLSFVASSSSSLPQAVLRSLRMCRLRLLEAVLRLRKQSFAPSKQSFAPARNPSLLQVVQTVLEVHSLLKGNVSFLWPILRSDSPSLLQKI